MSATPKCVVNILENEIGQFNPVFKNAGDLYINSDLQYMKKHDVKNLWFGMNDLIDSFIGRETDLEEIHCILEQNKSVVICGMGGIGKTELARKYAWEKKDTYFENVVWINSETKEYLEEAIFKLAIEIHVPIERQGTKRLTSSILEDIYECFEKRNCLIIFDNITDMSCIKKYLPSKKINKCKIYVLITSQSTEWGKINSISLKLLSEEQSVTLVQESIKDVCDCKNQMDDIKKLVEILQYHPLALQQAIAYITDQLIYVNEKFSIKDYINKFETEEPILDHRFDGDPFPDYSDNVYSNTVYVTVKLSMEKLAKCDHGIISFGILYVVAYLAPDDIPKYIFLPLTEFNNSEQLNIAIRNITKFSLMSEQNGKLKVHRLIQQILRCEFKKIRHYNFLKIALQFVVCNEHKESPHCSSALKYAQELNVINEFYTNKCSPFQRKVLLYCLGMYGYLKGIRDVADPEIYNNPHVSFHIVFAATRNGHLTVINHFINKGLVITDQDENGWSYLHQSAYYDQLDLCRIFINKGIFVDVKSNDGWTPLHFAAQIGHFRIIKFLTENNANINKQTNDGFTPLLLATQKGNLKIIKFMIQNQADIRVKCSNGLGVLHMAAVNNDTEILEYFIDKFNPDVCITTNGITPLHIACDRGNMNSIQFFIEHKFDVNFKSNEGLTPMRIAIEAGNLEMVKLLEEYRGALCAYDEWTEVKITTYLGHQHLLEYFLGKGFSVHEKTSNGVSLLHFAVEQNHEDVVNFLLQQGMTGNERNDSGYLPLHFASYYGTLNLLKLFINKGFSVDEKTDDGRTCLHLAAERGFKNIVEYVLENYADINAQTQKGLTALHLASEVGHMNIVEFLLNQGALVNIKTRDGVTPFHLACKLNKILIAEHLIENGALVNDTTNSGFSALHITAEKSHVHTIKFLIEIGLDKNLKSRNKWTPLNCAVLGGHVDAVRYLIDESVDIHAPTDEGLTPLHVAAFKSNLAIVELLIEAGSSTNAKNVHDNTPLQMAVGGGNIHIVKVLIRNGAIVNSLDIDHDSPLHSAASCSNLEIVKVLLENGAKVNYKNLNGETPLDLATKEGHADISQLLQINVAEKKILFETPINKNPSTRLFNMFQNQQTESQKTEDHEEDID